MKTDHDHSDHTPNLDDPGGHNIIFLPDAKRREQSSGIRSCSLREDIAETGTIFMILQMNTCLRRKTLPGGVEGLVGLNEVT